MEADTLAASAVPTRLTKGKLHCLTLSLTPSGFSFDVDSARRQASVLLHTVQISRRTDARSNLLSQTFQPLPTNCALNFTCHALISSSGTKFASWLGSPEV